MSTYEVIKDIPNGHQTSAKVGDVLTVASWGGNRFERFPTLMKGDKAV